MSERGVDVQPMKTGIMRLILHTKYACMHAHLSYTYMWFITEQLTSFFPVYTCAALRLLYVSVIDFLFFFIHCCLVTELSWHGQQES